MMGRIVNDLELKTTPQGTNVCSFRIAVDRRFQTKGEEKKSDFFNVVAWRQQAEFVTRYFSKGRMILVEGELNTRSYNDKNGNPSTWYEIVADRLSFTGEAKQQGAYSDAYGAPPLPPEPVRPAQQADAAAIASAETDDDYPF
jgi:single-strand DNA-binding protein